MLAVVRGRVGADRRRLDALRRDRQRERVVRAGEEARQLEGRLLVFAA